MLSPSTRQTLLISHHACNTNIFTALHTSVYVSMTVCVTYCFVIPTEQDKQYNDCIKIIRGEKKGTKLMDERVGSRFKRTSQHSP